jgi:mannose-6-phosphate isomerase
MLYPFIFKPIFKDRVWGGRKLAALYGKDLPPGTRIGESWEISDRPGDVSVIANGPLAGRDLHWLVENHAKELLGAARLQTGRFPLLIKLLDAQEELSLQVHPPAGKAAELGGEPKTEIWYIAQAEPGAALYVGLNRGVTRASFEAGLAAGTVADCFHKVPVSAGDAMFLPSGRVHAIGAGLVIFEIQQNSDTTYRVFDWNRLGLDGKARELHITQSLESIDFTDFEPGLVRPGATAEGDSKQFSLVKDPLFSVTRVELPAKGKLALKFGEMAIVGLVSGELGIESDGGTASTRPGQFCLVPASAKNVVLRAANAAELLLVKAGQD